MSLLNNDRKTNLLFRQYVGTANALLPTTSSFTNEPLKNINYVFNSAIQNQTVPNYLDLHYRISQLDICSNIPSDSSFAIPGTPLTFYKNIPLDPVPGAASQAWFKYIDPNNGVNQANNLLTGMVPFKHDDVNLDPTYLPILKRNFSTPPATNFINGGATNSTPLYWIQNAATGIIQFYANTNTLNNSNIKDELDGSTQNYAKAPRLSFIKYTGTYGASGGGGGGGGGGSSPWTTIGSNISYTTGTIIVSDISANDASFNDASFNNITASNLQVNGLNGPLMIGNNNSFAGTNAISIGIDAKAAANSIAIGWKADSNAAGDYNISIGTDAFSSNYGTALGHFSRAKSSKSIALGLGSKTNDAVIGQIAIGPTQQGTSGNIFAPNTGSSTAHVVFGACYDSSGNSSINAADTKNIVEFYKDGSIHSLGDISLNGKQILNIANATDNSGVPSWGQVKTLVNSNAGLWTGYANDISFTTGKIFTADICANDVSLASLTVDGLATIGPNTFPTITGNTGQVLTTDGAGNIIWSTVSGGGGGGGGVWTESGTDIYFTTGTVGIGTDDPSNTYILDVSGNTNLSGNLDVSDNLIVNGLTVLNQVYIAADGLDISASDIDICDSLVSRGVSVLNQVYIEGELDICASGITVDDIDICGSLIVGSNIFPMDTGVSGQVLSSDGNGTISWVNVQLGDNRTIGPNTYPNLTGNNGQVLTTDGAGNINWTTISGGSGGGGYSLWTEPWKLSTNSIHSNIFTAANVKNTIYYHGILLDNTGDYDKIHVRTSDNLTSHIFTLTITIHNASAGPQPNTTPLATTTLSINNSNNDKHDTIFTASFASATTLTRNNIYYVAVSWTGSDANALFGLQGSGMVGDVSSNKLVWEKPPAGSLDATVKASFWFTLYGEQINSATQGAIGIQGPTGPTGPTGPAGRGTQGITGAQGTAGDITNITKNIIDTAIGTNPTHDDKFYRKDGLWIYNDTSSDIRIKKSVSDVIDDDALIKLRLLQPKKYKYIDTQRTDSEVFGFMAQDVSNVIPYAVNRVQDYIPNIYEYANITNNGIFILNNTDTSVLNIGTMITFNDMNNNHYEHSVAQIIDNKKFTVNSYVFGEMSIFIYGTKVNDFHRLKKDYIWTIATAALQEVDRQLLAEKVKVANLQAENTSLKNDIIAIKSHLGMP